MVYEPNMTNSLPRCIQDKAWAPFLLVLLTLRVPFSRNHSFLHLLSPKKTSSDWRKLQQDPAQQMKLIFSRFRSLENDTKAYHEKVDKLDEKMDQMLVQLNAAAQFRPQERGPRAAEELEPHVKDAQMSPALDSRVRTSTTIQQRKRSQRSATALDTDVTENMKSALAFVTGATNITEEQEASGLAGSHPQHSQHVGRSRSFVESPVASGGGNPVSGSGSGSAHSGSVSPESLESSLKNALTLRAELFESVGASPDAGVLSHEQAAQLGEEAMHTVTALQDEIHQLRHSLATAARTVMVGGQTLRGWGPGDLHDAPLRAISRE
eukprot:COSAG05_NODE_2228_length_3363_cov_1.655331_4_plen_323_part_00